MLAASTCRRGVPMSCQSPGEADDVAACHKEQRMTPRYQPKIYHIVHVDRLPSIIKVGELVCDAEVHLQNFEGTTIGMNHIKERRLKELKLSSHPDLYVGKCVPFYFCPRSIMLYLIHRGNDELAYKGGQSSIVHLEADFYKTVETANRNNRRWAFTTSNAGSRYFEDFCDLKDITKINWKAVHATSWSDCKQEKQAECLVEDTFPWFLVDRIGVHNDSTYNKVCNALQGAEHKPVVEKIPDWYY